MKTKVLFFFIFIVFSCSQKEEKKEQNKPFTFVESKEKKEVFVIPEKPVRSERFKTSDNLKKIYLKIKSIRSENKFVKTIPALFPVQTGTQQITSFFGLRKHPVLGRLKQHRGIDIRADLKTPVIASANGIITLSDNIGDGYGNKIIIEHTAGFKTLYAHLDALFVKPGDQVTQGQIIGQVGTTGLSTAPHLHYEVIRNGIHMDAYFFVKINHYTF